MCKKMLIVTNCDPKRTKESERILKEIYLNKDSGPALNFAHKGTQPHEIAKLIKDKRPGVLLFEETVPYAEIKAILHAIIKHVTKRPRMLHINLQKHFEDIENVPNHTEVLVQLAA